ncbi:MAG: nucleoside hydrolase [Ruminococcaceae bacterium]|nr:nucleoside hydrolase [Oscillospiraceae bacterium]
MLTTKEFIEKLCSDENKNVILDCDTGADGDDQFALAYLLASDDRVNLIGVTSEPFNKNSDDTVAEGAKENEHIISLSGKDIPSVCGSADYVTNRKTAIESEAASFIITKAHEAEETLYIVLSGCAANVASAIMLCPEIKEKIAVIWLAMSDIYGQYPGEEYNFQNDPLAGQILVNSGVPFLLVPTKHIYPFRKTKDEVDALFSSDTPLCTNLRNRFREITWAQGLWDLGAVAVFTLPEAYSLKEVCAPILNEKGAVVAFDGRRTIAYAESLDTDKVLADTVEKLNRI